REPGHPSIVLGLLVDGIEEVGVNAVGGQRLGERPGIPDGDRIAIVMWDVRVPHNYTPTNSRLTGRTVAGTGSVPSLARSHACSTSPISRSAAFLACCSSGSDFSRVEIRGTLHSAPRMVSNRTSQ